jgi:hypothetical protein
MFDWIIWFPFMEFPSAVERPNVGQFSIKLFYQNLFFSFRKLNFHLGLVFRTLGLVR